MKRLKLFGKGIFWIFFYFFISIVLFYIFQNSIYNENTLLASSSTIFVYLLILLIFIIIFRTTLIPEFYEFKKNWRKYLKKNIKYWLIGLIVMAYSQVIISILFKVSATTQEANIESIYDSLIISFVSMIIVAPVIEELITRASFKDVFKNEIVFVLFSGILFGSLHLIAATSLQELIYIIPYSALGCAFAKIYYNTNNIWSSITFHAVHNLLAILIILLGV